MQNKPSITKNTIEIQWGEGVYRTAVTCLDVCIIDGISCKFYDEFFVNLYNILNLSSVKSKVISNTVYI